MSLRLRLWLSYALLIFLALGVAALGVVLSLRWVHDRLVATRLEYALIPLSAQLRRVQPLSAPQRLREIQDQVQDLNARLLLVDGQGRVVVDPLETWTGELFPVARRLPRPEGGGEGRWGVTRAPDGKPWIYVARPLPLPRLRLFLVLATPRSSVWASLPWILPAFLWGGGLALLAGLLIGAVLSGAIARPLARLERGAEEIAAGRYDVRIPEEGGRETAQLARRFNEMAAALEAARRREREFLASASHELKTPLTSIRGFAQALVEGEVTDPEGIREAARVILDEATRLSRLVGDLLDLARLEAGRLSLERRPLDLAPLLEKAVRALSPQAREKGIDLALEASAGLGTVGDPDRLGQVVRNLLDNALRHTPPGGEVRVRARAVDGGVEVRVEDTGPGVPPELRERIFERFFKGGGSTGSGLGLAVAREIVRAHGGRIWVEDAPGGGAAFVVRLPAGAGPTQG